MKKIVAILMFGVALLWANSLAEAEEQAKNVEKCSAGDAQACYEIGAFERACDLGHAGACYKCAYYSHSRNEKAKYYKKACELGSASDCSLALMEMTDWENRFNHREQRVYKQSLEEARVWLRKMCLNEANLLMCWLAISTSTNAYIDTDGSLTSVRGENKKPVLLIAGDERDNFIQKFKELRESLLQEYSKKCDEGETNTCVLLGKAFLDGYMRVWDKAGIDIDTDTAKAREFLQKACDAGEIEICKRYELTQDMSKFKAILQKSCELGNVEACPKLGKLYFEEAENADKDKAKDLYQKACDLNYADGCYKLGASYNVGRGVSQDIAKAKELYKKACDLENKSACKKFERLSK